MGRTRVAKAKIVELRSRFNSATKSKKEYSDYLKKLHNSYTHRKISYAKYVETLHQKREGRNIHEWIGYLDKYEKNCHSEIKKHQRKVASKNIVVALLSLFAFGFLIFFIVNSNLSLSGFAVQGNVNSEIISENTTQLPAILGSPVKWEKIIQFSDEGMVKVKVPEDAENINVTKMQDSYSVNEEVSQNGTSPSQEEPLQSETEKFSMTGAVISNSGFFKNFFGTLTGNAVSETEIKEIEFEIKDSESEYKIEYETPSPLAAEEKTENGKKIEIFSEVKYEKVLAFSEFEQEIPENRIKLHNNGEEIDFIAYDENNNGLVEKIEWIIPELTETEIYEIIIEISKAEHLDENKNFISDIFEQVKSQDGIWSEPINDNEYVRVTFEQKLDSSRDITIFPRITSGNPRIEIYEKDGTRVIAKFNSLNENDYNKVYLTDLQKEQDNFDLKILGGSIEFDYIVDPNITLITPPGMRDIGMAPLDNDTFVVTYVNLTSNSVVYEIRNTSGQVQRVATVVSSTNINPAFTRVAVASVNTTNFIIGWTNTTSVVMSGYSRGSASPYFGPLLVTAASISNATAWTQRQDIELTAFNRTMVGIYFIAPRMSNDTNFTRINAQSGAIIGTTQVHTNIIQETQLQNIISCDAVNRTFAGCAEYVAGGTDDVVRHGIQGIAGTEVFTDMAIDNNVGASAQVAVTSLNESVFVTAFYDTTDSDITFNITRAATGTSLLTSNIDIETNVGTMSRIAIATVRNITSNQDNFVVVWYNKTNEDICAAAYNNLGQKVMNPKVIESNPSNYSLFYVIGQDDATSNYTTTSLCTGTWAVAYSNYSNSTIYQTYFLNGSVWDGVCGAGAVVDTTRPAINITFPQQNNSNSSNINLDVNYTRSDAGGLANCWYSNDTFLVNISLGSTCDNVTSVIWADGTHIIRVYANDTSGNVNWSSKTFSIDSNRPAVNITFPAQNLTNWTNINLDINFTRSDTGVGVDACWYSNDSMLINRSLGSGGICENVSNITWINGRHRIIIYVNDSVGNFNWTSLNFTIDSFPPAVNITFPEINNSNSSNINLDINFTKTDVTMTIDSCWYSNDSMLINRSLGSGGVCENVSNITWAEGRHNIIIYVNDTLNNLNWTSKNFTIDITKPTINITFPPMNNSNWSNNGLDINYSRSDLNGLTNCWYSNDTFLINISLGTNCDNVTSVTWSDGRHTIRIFANDTSGNFNWTSLNFTIDTTQPDINITFPINNTVETDENLDINYTRSDSGLGLFNCWYSNDTYLANITLSNCENITAVTWATGPHNVTIWVNDSVGNYNRSTINFSIGSANVPPQIIAVYNTTADTIASAVGLNAGPSATYIEINFTVYDENGDLDDTTASVNISMVGETVRENSSCYKYESSSTYSNYTCNVTMWWYDGAGAWKINASISDLQSNFASNGSTNLSVGLTAGFEIGSTNLLWPTIIAGGRNQTSNNDPLVMNNTGNKPIGGFGPTAGFGNISINATNLVGEITPSFALYSGNFSVSYQTGGACTGAACVECAGDFMNKTKGNWANATSVNLTRGNFTADNRINGQEELYFCLKIAGTDLTAQPYSTAGEGIWTIKILLIAVVPAIKRKKRKIKTIKEDKLLNAVGLITDELKEKYSLNKKELLSIIIRELKMKYKVSREELIESTGLKEEIKIPSTIFSKELGFLEAISKYMKENLNMNYSEIARSIGRNERTIWTSYKKAKEKQVEILEIKKTDMTIPISALGNKNLTILESLVVYLKEKGMKYSEIAELLSRDQRNIRTIYIRTINKK